MGETGLGVTLERGPPRRSLGASVFALDALARLAAETGDHATSGELLSESELLAAHVAHVVDETDRSDAARAREINGQEPSVAW